MRVAFFSPLPPSPSGIADYSAALLEPLSKLANVDVYAARPRELDAARYDAIVYQLGNNPFHEFVYETALEHPGTVVMHEANLHHLIADRTIKCGDWDAYIAEVAFDGGDLDRARRVRALEVGPDYEGVPMLRRVLSRSKSAIAHSRYVESRLRANGFAGPVGVIPHGVWLPEIDRMSYREKLGVEMGAPLIGIFGHLKPYKRIAESLRAFRRLERVIPEARLLLVGDPHPELRLDPTPRIRHIGYAPIDDFTGYLAACDIVLNLRYPTVGETSGTLQRALGLGRAVIVSDVGAFAEYPDDVCLKAPVGAGEEDLIFEYLNLLASRPDVARAMGERARAWVERECPWTVAAERYVEFLSTGKLAERTTVSVEISRDSAPPEEAPRIEPETVTTWTNARPEEREYVETHLTRLARTLELTPPGTAEDRVLEMGAYMQITPALHFKLGYGEVRGCYYGELGRVDSKTVVAEDGTEFSCAIDHFDAEKDVFPYPDGRFATVLCCELIEHLPSDPMHTMAEINRILRDGGHLVLTTPNIASLRAIAAVFSGYHPALFPAYLKPEAVAQGESRHHREYTAKEIHLLLHYAGFDVLRLETGPFRDRPHPELAWVSQLIERYGFPKESRGEGIYAVGRKAGPVRDRYPNWLYA